jgi:hypothetical protein
VQRGTGVLSRLCGWLARLPPAAPFVPITVSITPRADGSQHWRRQFGAALMPSKLRADRSWLREDLGALTFWFALRVHNEGIDWRVARVRVLRVLPLPARWFAQVHAWSGAGADGRYRFVVHAQLPLLGLLVRYSGWLASDITGHAAPNDASRALC